MRVASKCKYSSIYNEITKLSIIISCLLPLLEAYLQNLHQIGIITPSVEIATDNFKIMMMSLFFLILSDKLMLHFLVLEVRMGVRVGPLPIQKVDDFRRGFLSDVCRLEVVDD